MHWLLDVHFEEDWCRVEDKNIQKNLNIFRKCAINLIKLYKSESESKKPKNPCTCVKSRLEPVHIKLKSRLANGW